jgi:hypothetical protein
MPTVKNDASKVLVEDILICMNVLPKGEHFPVLYTKFQMYDL